MVVWNSLAGEIEPVSVNVVTWPLQEFPSTGAGAIAGVETCRPVWSTAVAVDFVGATSSDRKVVACGRRALVKLIVPAPAVLPLVLTFVKVLSGPS
jgi:hypothetical protein